MKRLSMSLLAAGILAATAFAMRALADDPPGPPPEKAGPSDHEGPGGGPGGPGGPRGPAPGFHLLPRWVAEQLKLTDDQKTQVDALEKETKAKLEKILTPEQKKILETARPPRPGQGGPRGPGGNRRGPGNGRRQPGGDSPGPEGGQGGPEGGPQRPDRNSGF